MQLIACDSTGQDCALDIEVVERQRDMTPCVRLRNFMVEVNADDLPPQHSYVGAEAGFEVVAPERSVIFWSKDADGMCLLLAI